MLVQLHVSTAVMFDNQHTGEVIYFLTEEVSDQLIYIVTYSGRYTGSFIPVIVLITRCWL